MSTLQPFKTKINNNFIKKIFNKNKKTNINFNNEITTLITHKTKLKDITDYIKKTYIDITTPYSYDEIKHILIYIRELYNRITIILQSYINYKSHSQRSNSNSNSSKIDYDEYIIYKYTPNKFILNNDFIKLFDSIFECLKKSNINYYNVYKKAVGKTKPYYVLKFIINNKTIYLLFSHVLLENQNNSHKISIDVFDDYNFLKRIINSIDSTYSPNPRPRTSTKSSKSSSKSI